MARDTRQVFAVVRPLYLVCSFQHPLGHCHVLCTTLEDMALADVSEPQARHVSSFRHRSLVSILRFYRIIKLMCLGSTIIFAVFRLAWAMLLLLKTDFSYVKFQGTIFALAELACGITCSCLFVLPRLYRHLTASPPYNSEEYRLRKWKKLASSGEKRLGPAQFERIHHKEEKRNPWENEIEVPGALTNDSSGREEGLQHHNGASSFV